MRFDFYMNIYAEDVDFGSIVYHANYLRYAERSRSQYLATKGFSLRQCADQFIFFVVKEAQMDFIKPAFLSDTLIIGCEIKKIGRSTLKIHQPIWRLLGQEENSNEKRELICNIDVLLVHINRDFKPSSIPDKIVRAIKDDA